MKGTWGGWKGLGGGARADATWCLRPFLTYRRRKEEQNSEKPWGNLLLPVPHLPLTHPARHRAGSRALRATAAFISADPRVFCAAQHWVSAGLTRDTHTPSLPNNGALSSPCPGQTSLGGPLCLLEGFLVPTFFSLSFPELE